MKIKTKSKLGKLFCKHNYETGILRDTSKPLFFNLSGDTHIIICTKCGKIKGTFFVRNRDGS